MTERHVKPRHSYLTHLADPPSERDGDEHVALLGRVLTLAKKYDAPGIHILATRLVEKYWPSNYSMWEKDRNSRTEPIEPGAPHILGVGGCTHSH